MSENMMKAAIFQGIGDIKIEDRPIPVPGKKDVLVKNLKGSICGSDVTCFKFGGKYVGIDDGKEFGHEMVSVVCAVGEEVPSEIKEGMRVFVNPMTCKKLGRRYAMMAGAFSQYVLVENAEIGYNLYPIPDNVTDHEAVLVEPFCVANHGVNVLCPVVGQKAVIFGAGPIGLAASQSLFGKGINDVVIVDIAQWRLDKAQSMGVTGFNPLQGDLKEFLIEKFGAADRGTVDVDLYIDAAGVPSVLTDFLSLSKPGSKISIIAVHKDEVKINPQVFMSKEIQFRGASGYQPSDINEVIGFLKDKKTKISDIITHHYPLVDTLEAHATAADPSKSIKVVIDFE